MPRSHPLPESATNQLFLDVMNFSVQKNRCTYQRPTGQQTASVRRSQLIVLSAGRTFIWPIHFAKLFDFVGEVAGAKTVRKRDFFVSDTRHRNAIGRRQLLWFEVTRHPTAEWAGPANDRGVSLGVDAGLSGAR